MPTWTTHVEGGSWLSPGGTVTDCSKPQQDTIVNAYNDFISDSCLDKFIGLKSCLESKWKVVEVDCTDPDCGSIDGRQSGDKILICDTWPWRVGSLLLHEMVHVCDGEELDSEAVEHACFVGRGATLPTSGDWDKFRSETSKLDSNILERVAKYVIWNSDTGEVWTKKTDSSGKVVKGNRIFQSDQWKHDYDSGGGWI
ncbi:MAG: hypothetical protein ACFFD6_07015 [Candidatus Thorarchaeota archaeon]